MTTDPATLEAELLRWLKVALLSVFLFHCATAEARERAPVRAFRATHLCPSTGDKTGPCPGFVVDHITPLCFDGLDDPSNMAWQEKAESYKKDAFERAACKLKKELELERLIREVTH